VLVLSRHAGESVVIANDIVVTILEVRGDVVRVGIDAPRHIQVHREEVHRELLAANQAAAASANPEAISGLAAILAGGEVTEPEPNASGPTPADAPRESASDSAGETD
jgi:carbon storage regulator